MRRAAQVMIDLLFVQQAGLGADFRFKNFNGGIYSDYELTALPGAPPETERRNGRFLFRANSFTGGRVGSGRLSLSVSPVPRFDSATASKRQSSKFQRPPKPDACIEKPFDVLVMALAIENAATIGVVGDAAGALSRQLFPVEGSTVFPFELLLPVAEMLEDFHVFLAIACVDVQLVPKPVLPRE